MATQSFQLVMRAGPSIGKVFPISKGEMHIGRDISNEIVINDAEVSRKHVRIVIQAGEVIIEDLGSTNGTFVNEQRISGPYTLVAGDTLQLGEHVLLVFEAALQASDATVAVPPGGVMPAPDFDGEPTPLQPLPAPSTMPPPPPAYELPSMPSATDMSGPSSFQAPAEPPKDNRRTIIIVVSAVVVLCCVCPALGSAIYYALQAMGMF
ncbi:MAG: FHA domain-containing protein [Anaerolineales bacterium]|nr:FHA domain-containing protein [Anaerolineales bacterium]